MLHNVFWGPDHTLGFVRTRGRRTLLLQGAYEDSHIIPVRRAFLTMLAATWAGWSVRWANYGLFNVLAPRTRSRSRPRTAPT